MSVMTAPVKRKRKIQKPLQVSKFSANGRVPKSMEISVDPFRYGFRYIEETDAQGKIKWTQMPLTLDDVLHPQVGDFIAQSSEHDAVCDYAKTVCKHQSKSRLDTVALHDVRVDLNVPGVKPVGPDVALFFDVQKKKDWSTFSVADEGTIPALIFEVTSPSTRHQDFGEKKEYYERAGIPIYVIIDKYKAGDGKLENVEFRLHGFTLINGRYVDMEFDERGWLWLEPIQSWLRVDGPEVEFYDSQGQPIPDYEELKKRAEDADNRIQEAEDAKRVFEEKVDSAESRAQEAENAKQAAETRAHEAEDAKRVFEEKVDSAETRAQEAENAKQAAETRAQEAEDARLAMEEELRRLRAMVAQEANNHHEEG